MAQLLTPSFTAKADTPNAQKLITEHGFQTLSVCFAAGQSMPAHKHPNKTVLLHVIKGKLELISDDERTGVSEGQLVVFSGDNLHALENTYAGQTNVVVTAIPKQN